MTEQELIKRAIESAKCRIYRVRANVGESLAHQIKADNQAEIMQVTIDALEKKIAKKPEKENGDCIALSRDGKETFEIIYRCPSCNSRKLIFGYPCKCGQKLDWGNEDDRD